MFLLLVLGFLGITFAQAWAMTHYAPVDARSSRLADLSLWDKARLLASGPTIRRQSNTKTPAEIGLLYETVRYAGAGGLQLEAWHIDGRADKSTVLLFPGYGASKDTLLGAARELARLGHPLWLVDPHGIGGSAGNVTSIGYHEAEDVRATFEEVRRRDPARSIVLYGVSAGAVAIMRAVSVGWIVPRAIILECPFDRFTHTIGNRFATLGLPQFPFAPAVAGWVGVQQGFNGWQHNPVSYARRIECPTLLLQGELDESVGRAWVREVGRAFGPRAQFELIPNAGHAFLVARAPEPWRRTVQAFLAN